jgi:HEAT repeat protein
MTAFLTTVLTAAALVAAPGLSGGPAFAALHAQQGRAAAPSMDSADSLYRTAREALNRSDFRRASQLFGRVASRYADADVAGDALYWQAYALYRQGAARDLREASKALKAHKEKYPKAGTRGDADALATRIDGALARQGDAGSAERIGRQADAAARDSGCVRSGDDDDDMRVAALNALMQMDADRALPVLRQVLARRDACSAPLRRKAVFIVSQQRSGETEDILLAAARSDPDGEVREQAVFWLGQVRSERAITALDSIMRNAGSQELREKALFALSQQNVDRARAALRSVAEDTAQSQELREKAIFWIGQQRSPENADYLRRLFERTRSEELREKIMFSLSQMRGEGNDKWLLGIVSDKRNALETRKRALFSAGQNQASVTELVGLWTKLDEQEMKEQLIFVLHERRDAAAIDKLIDIAKTEKNVELRKKAIFWLGQSRDPRVQQLLVDIINQ